MKVKEIIGFCMFIVGMIGELFMILNLPSIPNFNMARCWGVIITATVMMIVGFLMSKSRIQEEYHGLRREARRNKQKKEILAKLADEGYTLVGGWAIAESDPIIGEVTLTRDGKRYHGNFTGKVWECVSNPDFPRAEDDRRCLLCEGWGCCACSHNGGY